MLVGSSFSDPDFWGTVGLSNWSGPSGPPRPQQRGAGAAARGRLPREDIIFHRFSFCRFSVDLVISSLFVILTLLCFLVAVVAGAFFFQCKKQPSALDGLPQILCSEDLVSANGAPDLKVRSSEQAAAS